MVADKLTRLATVTRRIADRLLFRVPSLEPTPIVLGQRRIFVLPTKAGITFSLALLVMLIASINYTLSLGYALVFLLGGAAAASMFHAFRNLLHLSIRTGRTDPVFSGDIAQYRLIVDNPLNRRRPALRFVSSHKAIRETFDAAPQQVTEQTLSHPTSQRGWQPIGRIVLETLYPLGLIRAWSVLKPDARCLVYPTPEQDPPNFPEGSVGTTNRRSGDRGDDDFAGLRAYDPADSPKHIAWKVVARDGPMLTKRFSGSDGGDLRLDWFELPANLDLEQKISRLTAWAILADAQGRAFSLRLPNARVGLGSGANHLHACLTKLALYPGGNNAAD